MTINSGNKGHILLLDDDQNILSAVSSSLSQQGYTISQYQRAKEAILALESPQMDLQPFDLVITDLRLPGIDGLSFVSRSKELKPDLPIIIMTAYASIKTSIQAIRLGAFDFLRKPFNTSELALSVERALTHSRLVIDNNTLKNEIKAKWKFDQVVSKSAKMQVVFDLIQRISNTNTTVLITGESGSGKEMIARAIHQNGQQKDKPFVAINCASIPETLLESELFGHAKGSFTGAYQNRKGLFQEAEDGILFLDEIGDMPMALQAKLLRVLQDKKVKPVGENNYKQVNVRILAATHRDIKDSIKKGLFREDLFYRLNVISISVPPLRERKEDIIVLAEHFLKKFAAIHHTSVRKFSKEALSKLVSEQWPGNIRELENAIERASVICTGAEVGVKDLAIDEVKSEDVFQKPTGAEYLSLSEVENRYISFILGKTNGKKEKAASILKIDRTTLHRKIVEYGLTESRNEDAYEFCNNINGNKDYRQTH